MAEPTANKDKVSAALLVVEDDPGLQRQMRWAFADSFSVQIAHDRNGALSVMARDKPAMVVLDLGLPPDPNGASEGLSILESILAEYPSTKVIVASGNEDRNNALKAISLGAYDFFAKPIDVDQLRLILERALHVSILEAENRRLAHSVRSGLDGVIAASDAMIEVNRTIERIATTDVSVLILGESGTGKELVARGLHQLSHRADKPFVAVNCAAIPETLLESELFGYEKGAFTGAVKQTIGKVEQARGGTLFLDEIGDMPLSLQAKMLRFLQNRSIQRLGGQDEVAVDVRFVSASNRLIEEMARSGGFREDLYFRINEVSIQMPPLRDREGDSILIATSLLRKYCETYRRGPFGFSPDAVAAISNYRWPGNVRELENRVKRAVVLASGASITADDLGLAAATGTENLLTLKQARQKAEIDAIKRAMAACGNNQTQAAKLLGVSRPTLYNLLSGYDIKVETE